jgi:predicted DNA-binding transcriptional regulator AlpA
MDAVDNLTLELWGLERLLNINELAAYLRVPVSTIYEWRTKGQAPLAHRYGKHLTFAAADVVDVDTVHARLASAFAAA